MKARPAFKGPAGRAPRLVTRTGVTCRASGRSPQPRLRSPPPLSSPESGHRCPLPPRGEPQPQLEGQRRSSLQARSLLRSPSLPGTPRLTVPAPRAPPPLGSPRSSRAGCRQRRVAAAPGAARGRGVGFAASRPRPLPGPPPTPRRPPAPPPPSQKDRTTEKPPPAKLCNCPSNRQKKTLLPTQMWGSFQDPSSGEFLGGTGRKPPTFHADRRLQTVCCSCNEILIFPPFFLSLAPLFFFFSLWCV